VRRWALVAAGVALLCGLPVIASALPVSVPRLTASQLRARILASADESYAGYAGYQARTDREIPVVRLSPTPSD